VRPAFAADREGHIAVGGVPSAAEPTSGAPWSLLVAGDWASCRCFADAAARKPEDLYGPLLDDIRGAELAVVNLECALGGQTPLPKDGPNLKGDPASGAALAAAGFHVAAIGNNHVFDYGATGLRATLDACRSAGLATVGAGEHLEQATRPLLVERGGVRIGILSFADREEGDAEPDRPGVAPATDVHVLDRVRRLRQEADVSIVLVHGGREYVPVPPTYWYDRVLAIAGAGADLVVGHHPHVPQGAVLLDSPDGRRVPVLFSTGNFVFRPAAPAADEIPPRTRDGYLVRARFDGTRMAGLTLVPYVVDEQLGPRPVAPDDRRHFVKLLESLSKPLSSRPAVRDWFDAVVDHQWAHGYRQRVEVLTRKMCEGDAEALRHARSHHRSAAHLTIIDRAIERQLHGLVGTAPGETIEQLRGWYEGTWPCPPSRPADARVT
jgi:poly-gamma-glutamate synthesis protein (capsule biosynthesis protein)